MGVRLFGQDISGAIKRSMANGLPKITLKKLVPGQIDPANPAAPVADARRSYPCRGFVDSSDDVRRQAGALSRSEKVVLVIGDTLPRGVVPAPGDRLVVLGATLEIVGDGVSADPALATYLCVCVG